MYSLLCRESVRRAAAVVVTFGVGAAGSTACGNAGSEQVPTNGVAVILKTSSNPFFLAILSGAEEQAAADDLSLTVASGKVDGDTASQVTAIDAAMDRGDKAILITPNGPDVNGALKRARDKGIFVVALDTKPTDPAAADITFATDNFEAGRLIGDWAAKKFSGRPAVIAMLDLFGNRGVESDSGRDQGFLTGMGIPVADPAQKGDESPTGTYSAGTYEIVCQETTLGSEDGGRSAMERCLAANPGINLVYTINEPAASGAAEVLQAAGNPATIVSVDGGCDPGMTLVQSGVVGATAQQYPLDMAKQGIDAIAAYLKDGTRPIPNNGIDMVATGVTLVTDDPQPDVPSIDVAEGLTRCWGNPS